MNKFIIVLLILSSCTRAPLKNKTDSMRLTDAPKEISDSLTSQSFMTTLVKHIEVMRVSGLVSDPLVFGNKSISKCEYIKSLELILDHKDDWQNYIKTNFDFYEVYGKDRWGEVFSTGYYEPVVKGSKIKTENFSRALLADPGDIFTIDLKNFSDKLPKEAQNIKLSGQIINKKFVPYFDRDDIDVNQKLKTKNLELYWVDPIDAFFIQIQGSGVIEFENNEKVRVGYAAQNGHPYIAIGKFLTKEIPLKEMSMQRIRKYLQSLSQIEMQKILNLNPSYVFFKVLQSEALTFAGMEASPGRTIATDKNFFPKGALAYFNINEPDSQDTSKTIFKPRFVFDQDTGGAITGGGRVDLFYGGTEEAAIKAGVMKETGQLYYLVPRATNLCQ